MKDLPVLTKQRLHSVGIYKKLKPEEKKRLREGSLVELEHIKGNENKLVAVKIAMDHLKEDPRYYKKLKKAGL